MTMTILERTYRRATATPVDELLFSADSHVIEPEGLWKRELPPSLRGRAPELGGRRSGDHPGAMEKAERLQEMAADGVSGEVLFPTHGLRLLSLEDPELEEACIRVYNDWMIDYCQVDPSRLLGLAMLSVYNIDRAIAEMERCRGAGLRGVTIWQVPHPDLPFSSPHYDRLWAAAQDLDIPINLHILSGFGYSAARGPGLPQGLNQHRNSVNHKIVQVMDVLYDFIFAGVLDRYPRLKIVLAESEVGWLPFVLEQWDYYHSRHGASRPESMLPLAPSAYFNRQVYPTFFNDAVGAHLLDWWGQDNCMWSNDYPHGNSTWPNSREVVGLDMGTMAAEARAKLVRLNVAQLYNIALPKPIPRTQATTP
jgi:predicted TIM-barrel fold metal-dependent hydrolase